jgi:dipeptidase E
MKRLYLAASIDRTGPSIAKDIQKETGKSVNNLKTVFINTSSEDTGKDKTWLKEDRDGLVKGGFNLFDYTITGKTTKDLDKDLGDCDVIHVNGGNTFYLLVQIRKSGFDKWIRKFILEGKKIYIGSSAGSIVTSPNVEIAKRLESKVYMKNTETFEGMNLVDFIILPHWGSDNLKTVYESPS